LTHANHTADASLLPSKLALDQDNLSAFLRALKLECCKFVLVSEMELGGALSF
jgi:hypothetical protein